MKGERSCLSSALLASGIILCLALLLAAVGYIELTKRAERLFGPPADTLPPTQRIFLSALLLMQMEQLREPLDPNGADLTFEVQLGESTYKITERLQAAGLIADANLFRDYLVYTGLDTGLQTGIHRLNPNSSPLDIATALQDATPGNITFIVLPGWRMEEIAEALPTSGLSFSPQAFLDSVSSPLWHSSIEDDLPEGAGLEGFLFPDSYRLSRDTTAETFVAILISNFQVKVDYEMRQGFERQGLGLHQAITLAAIIEREAIQIDEMPMIASVFYNRLVDGMHLDTDPTVQYAIGYNPVQETWWTNPLSLEDLQINSPYNTYKYPGLPPGPIANPGQPALKAAAFPATTPYYYFRAACDGSGRHSFAETFAEHVQNACP